MSDPSGNDGVSYEPTMEFPYDGQERALKTAGGSTGSRSSHHHPPRKAQEPPRLDSFHSVFGGADIFVGARDPSILTRSTTCRHPEFQQKPVRESPSADIGAGIEERTKWRVCFPRAEKTTGCNV